MKKKILKFLKIILFAGLGVFLFSLVYKDFDFKGFFQSLTDISWGWILLAVLVMLASHFSRAMRWNLLLTSVAENGKPRLMNTFWAVMNMYFVNMALPRVGEVTRSSLVSRYDNIPFSKVLGTMVTERAMDVLMLVILVVVVIFAQGAVFSEVILENQDMMSKFGFLFRPWFWIICSLIGIGSLVFIIMIAKGKFDSIAVFKKVGEFIRNFFDGIRSIAKLERPWAFIGHSIFIYLMYFLMLYLCFYAFPYTNDLGLMAALTIFVLGSIGMVVPVPNGMGAWHFITMQALFMYGIPKMHGESFALVAHSAQMVLLIVFGVISFIALPIINRKKI